MVDAPQGVVAAGAVDLDAPEVGLRPVLEIAGERSHLVADRAVRDVPVGELVAPGGRVVDRRGGGDHGVPLVRAIGGQDRTGRDRAGRDEHGGDVLDAIEQVVVDQELRRARDVAPLPRPRRRTVTEELERALDPVGPGPGTDDRTHPRAVDAGEERPQVEGDARLEPSDRDRLRARNYPPARRLDQIDQARERVDRGAFVQPQVEPGLGVVDVEQARQIGPDPLLGRQAQRGLPERPPVGGPAPLDAEHVFTGGEARRAVAIRPVAEQRAERHPHRGATGRRDPALVRAARAARRHDGKGHVEGRARLDGERERVLERSVELEPEVAGKLRRCRPVEVRRQRHARVARGQSGAQPRSGAEERHELASLHAHSVSG